MELGLQGRVAMIVGATRGFGRACASVFAQEGARLALVARGRSELEKVAAEARAIRDVPVEIFPADFTIASEPARIAASIAAHYGRIDALVNTVGVTTVSPAGALGEDALWEEAFQSVLMVAVRTCRAVVPIMQMNGGGAIVNTSALSTRHYLPTIAHYSAQKAAVAHFTKNLAIQFGKDRIRANIVLPGAIASEQVEQMLDRIRGRSDLGAAESLNRGYEVARTHAGMSRQDAWEVLNAEMHHVTWSGRMGDPVEFARVAAFLCSDAASYVSGAWVNIDGGSMF
ncbi:MAG: SDR family NAD(P)-dependent oxidoreductase [Gammaproteobacteria bacterium]